MPKVYILPGSFGSYELCCLPSNFVLLVFVVEMHLDCRFLKTACACGEVSVMQYKNLQYIVDGNL